jgi:hypothetical protein
MLSPPPNNGVTETILSWATFLAGDNSVKGGLGGPTMSGGSPASTPAA